MENVLQRILSSVEERALNDERMLVVFDLDSTIFDVSYRIHHILREFAQREEIRREYRFEAEKLEQLELHEKDWGIRTALERMGVTADKESFFRKVYEYWRQEFFSNSHLHLDQPYPGAVEYVQNLYRAGAEIMYLTARDINRMGTGTEASLLQWKLPFQQPLTSLVMKPEASIEDADFKQDHLQKLDGKYPEIWFFENEPVIINRVHRTCPHVQIVFMDSVHSGREEVPEHVDRIRMKFDF